MAKFRPAKFRLSADVWICLGLAAITLAAYSGVRHFGYITFDDPFYPQNYHLRDGWTWDAVKWAFTTGVMGNWNPLVWLSLLEDIQLFGPQPGPAHMTAVLIHILDALMLFVFLRRATGTRWRSALVAYLFAMHPLHIESVAWISERKDVLSAFFWFLTCWCWVRYAERPGGAHYLLAVLAYTLGLMSKPMLVTLPFVLLLLDYWPLRRRDSVGRLALEKVPFLALAAIDSAITFYIQKDLGAMSTLVAISAGLRVENALVSTMTYLGQMVWPVRMAMIYPYPKSLPVWEPALAGVAIAAASFAAIRAARVLPYLPVGWFWYLGTLVPVIGLVQVGVQARADRYTYIPMVGVSIVLAWGAADIARRWQGSKPWVVGGLAAGCLALLPVTEQQLEFWREPLGLYGHAIEVTGPNYVAHNIRGQALRVMPGRIADSLADFDAVVRLAPQWGEGHSQHGETLWKLGRKAEAVAEYKTAIRLNPHYAEAHVNYGAALADEGKWEEAVLEYNKALAIDRESARAFFNRGNALLAQGRITEALNSFDHSLAIDPANPEALNNTGVALAKAGHWEDSLVEFAAAVKVNPEYGDAWRNRGEALIHTNRMYDAVESLHMAAKYRPADAAVHTLAASALLNLPGRRAETVEELRAAVRLDPGLEGAQEMLGHLLADDPATRAEAIAHMEAAVRLYPGPALKDYLARLRARR